MKKGKITVEEIASAIKQTKGNRAPGEDRVTADMLKADPHLSAQMLVKLLNQAWGEEKVPDDWKKGIIVKLPKKGDLSVCGNWRGINLLSVPGKIFCRVLLQRIRQGVDKRVREEQAGFRCGRSCTDQIFVLRNIVEQSLEWNSSLYINFIDFEKAFDSIHHPSLWHIMSLYGLPPKVINIVKDMYANNLCCVRHEGQHSEWFQVKTGVRQGCIISPLLFLIVIDYVMRTATADKPRGLVWGLFHRLEDSDFADDLALLAHTHSDIQEKTDRVVSTAKKVGLKIHAAKTKVTKAKKKFRVPVTVEGEPLEEVKDFKYLGSYISSDSNIDKEVSTRIGLAAQAFKKLNNIWKSTTLSTKTKLRIYQSNVRSTLLYASETWRTNKKLESNGITTQYNDLTTQYNGITTKYNGITTHYNDITTQYNNITTQYNNITTQYNEITTQYYRITTQYNDITTQYNDITTQYNNITTQYNDITTQYLTIIPRARMGYESIDHEVEGRMVH